ncbi:MAG: cytochrome b/b6 domain-containing protein [Actinomycetota bacterium]
MTAVTEPPTEQPDGPPAPPERVAVRKHRRGTRWMHWINFPLLTIMIWSGLRIYWADVRDPFGFGVGLVGWHWFDFLPDAVNERLGLERRLARGMAFHFTFGWLFTLNGIAYGIYTWRTGEWRHLLPDRHSLRDAVAVTRHDLFLGRGRPLPPQGRYNGAQRWSYTLIIFLGAIGVLTGLAIYKPTQLNLLTLLFGGYESARTIHFVVTIAFLVFFVVHLLQVARAGWANFASMINGYELQPVAAGLAVVPEAVEDTEDPEDTEDAEDPEDTEDPEDAEDPEDTEDAEDPEDTEDPERVEDEDDD